MIKILKVLIYRLVGRLRKRKGVYGEHDFTVMTAEEIRSIRENRWKHIYARRAKLYDELAPKKINECKKLQSNRISSGSIKRIGN